MGQIPLTESEIKRVQQFYDRMARLAATAETIEERRQRYNQQVLEIAESLDVGPHIDDALLTERYDFEQTTTQIAEWLKVAADR